MTEILLIEDDAALGRLLKGDLELAGFRVRWETRGRAGVLAMAEREPDVVLLDLVLPDQLGFAVLREIRMQSQVPVIILTGRDMGAERLLGFDLGADDYLTKPFWTEELVARIRARLRRAVAVAPKQGPSSCFGELELHSEGRWVRVAGRAVPLTPTEFTILEYLVARAGRAIRRETLRDLLFGADPSEAALNIHLCRIRRKLGSEGERIRTVWGVGYRFDSDPALARA